MKTKKILFIEDDDKAHYVHREFAKTVTNDFVLYSGKIPKDYDVYLVELGFPKFVFYRMIGKINRKSKIICIFADPRLYFMIKGKYLDISKDKVVKYPFWKYVLYKFLLNKVDGVICVSTLEQDLLKSFNSKIPSRVVYPFIHNDSYPKLKKISPGLSTHNIIFIGNGPDYYYKDVNLMIDSFKLLKQKVPDSKLYILGNWDIKKRWKIPGVYFEGRRDIFPYLKKCSLCVHPGRGEGFGVSVVDSMFAGVPPIVSKDTGAKDAVLKVDSQLLFELNSKDISTKIVDYFNKPLKEKRELSLKCRLVAKEFTQKKQVIEFKRSFNEILDEI